MKKLSAVIIFGGSSSEHEVSRVSAASVIENIPKDKYDVHVIGITKSGEWYYYTGDIALLADGSWENDNSLTPAIISPDRKIHGIQVLKQDEFPKSIYVDVAFPVMHGKYGEDGSMQGLFELAGIPYVGCDVASSAICMDKALTNTVLEHGGINQAKFVAFNRYTYEKETELYLNKIENELKYPCFVKPANAGSSVGISKAKSRQELINAISNAFIHDLKVVVEEGITGKEVEVAVMGNEEPVASAVGEIAPANDWYDYEAKYQNAASELFIPARISEEKQNEIRREAVRAYSILGCSGLARVDFFVREGDEAVLLNEPNTIPGFTSISMYPKLFGAVGISYPELIDKLMTYAIERSEKL